MNKTEIKSRRVLRHRECKKQLILKNLEPKTDSVRVLAKKSFVRPIRIKQNVNKNKNNFIPTIPTIDIVPEEVAMFTKEMLLKDMDNTVKQLNESGFSMDLDEYKNRIDDNLIRYSKISIDFMGQMRIDEHNPFHILLDEFKGDMEEYERIKLQFVQKPEKIQHITWCCECGESTNLINCTYCCIAFHYGCNNVVASKTRSSIDKIRNDLQKFCPRCKSGQVLCSGDIVWHKLKTFSWWPARIIPLRDKPKCLVYPPTPNHFPIYYYGTKNYAWGDIRQMFAFSKNYNELLNDINNILLQDAILEALEVYEVICKDTKNL